MSSRPVQRLRTIASAVVLLTAALTAAPQAMAQSNGTAHTGTIHATTAQLTAAGAAVRQADVGGTAWYADATAGRLVVTADSTVTQEQISRIEAAVRDTAPGAPEIRRVPGRIAERIAGGEIIIGPGGVRCTVGFNVQSSTGAKYALTAGHCTALGGTWSPVGPVVATSFPGNDYGLIQYTDPSKAEGGVRGPDGTFIDIVDAANPPVGRQVCALTSISGPFCGIVTAVNATVNYGDGSVVSGLIQTTLCSEPGMSGAPVYSGHTAIGILSGGSGNCTSGGTTFVQPVLEPLNAYGVSVF